MIRLVAIALIAALAWIALVFVVRKLNRSDLDWNGIAFACGFVALAFYLRHATGLG